MYFKNILLTFFCISCILLAAGCSQENNDVVDDLRKVTIQQPDKHADTDADQKPVSTVVDTYRESIDYDSVYEDSIDRFDAASVDEDYDDAYSMYESLVEKRNLAAKDMARAIESIYKPTETQKKNILGECWQFMKKVSSKSQQKKAKIARKKIKIVKDCFEHVKLQNIRLQRGTDPNSTKGIVQSNEKEEAKEVESLSKEELVEAAWLLLQVLEDEKRLSIIFLGDNFYSAVNKTVEKLENIETKNDQEIYNVFVEAAKILELIVSGDQGHWDL